MENNRYTALPETSQQISPAALYERYYDYFNPTNILYCTVPLTSAGIALALPSSKVAERLAQVKRINGHMAERILSYVVTDLQIIMPHRMIGPNWGEDEYMTWWAAIILGLPPDALYEFSGNADMFYSRDIMNDHTRPKNQRKEEYSRFAQGFLEIASQYLRNPIGQHVLFPGYHLSLGSTLERYISRTMGNPVHVVTFDKNHHEYRKTADGIYFRILKESCGFEPPTFDGDGSSLVKLIPDAQPVEDWFT